MATDYAAYPDHPLHGVPDEILQAARDMMRGAVIWGSVDTQMADPLADAVVMAVTPWLKY